MASFKNWWVGLSKREQALMGVMFALLAVVVLWLGIIRPIEGALVASRERHAVALDRNAAVVAKVALLKSGGGKSGARSLGAPLVQVIGQSAGEAGFTLDRNTAQGDSRTDIAIASARPTALFAWIAALEGRGISVETLTVQPSGTSGTVSVQAVLKVSP